MRLFKFKGGVKPPYHKEESVQLPIAQVPLPSYLAIPLHQNVGGTPRPLVSVGQHVKKGEKIGAADGWVSASVHASTSGQVVQIGPHAFPHPSGLTAVSVFIEPDGKDEWFSPKKVTSTIELEDPAKVLERLREYGIVGLGGASFPSHAKMQVNSNCPFEELVINGAECEPYITCDDLLMRERADGIVSGIQVLNLLMSPKRVLIGIEDNKPEAIAMMRQAVERSGYAFEVVAVPTRYPAGGAKQLIRVLTGKEVPAGKRSTEFGVQCFNVATAYGIGRVMLQDEPMISRIVTVTGDVTAPQNFEVLIGTPMNELLNLVQPKRQLEHIIMGGPMMGFAVPDIQSPVIKATNCLIAESSQHVYRPPMEMPCIRCGACADVCPHELQPFEMYWFTRAKDFDKVSGYHIQDCIECGCCSYVCPAHIPLVHYFRFAKGEIHQKNQAQKEAEQARQRFEFHQFRDAREKAEKAERIAKAAAAQAAKMAAEASETTATTTTQTTASIQTTATTPTIPTTTQTPAISAETMQAVGTQISTNTADAISVSHEQNN